MKNLSSKILIFAIICLFLAAPVLADTEMAYPEINFLGQPYNLNSDSVTSDFVVYFYVFFIEISTAIAAVVIIAAGLQMIVSSGYPDRFSRAKTKALGAVIGVGALYVLYFILKAINPTLLSPKNLELTCDNTKLSVCIERLVKNSNGKDKVYTEMSFDSQPNLNFKAGESITIKRYDGLREVWTYPEANYSGQPKRIYKDATNDFNSPLPSPLVLDSKVKSVKIFPKREGMYFYDAPENPPTVIAQSNANTKLTGTVEILNNPASEQKYYALGFGASSYNNYGVSNSILKTDYNFCLPITDVYGGVTAATLKSILLFQSKLSGEQVGTLTFYNTIKCGAGAAQTKSCSISVFDSLYTDKGELDVKKINAAINQACPSANWQSGENLLSFRIDGHFGVMMWASSGASGFSACKYWDNYVVSKGNCVEFDNYFTLWRPEYFLIIPFNNKL